MKKTIISFSILSIIFLSLMSYAKSNVYIGGPKHSFDVLNYKLNLDIYNCFAPPYSNSFSAINQITFKVDSTLNFVKLNADTNYLIIDSVKLLNGLLLPFYISSNILTIYLDRIYVPNEITDVKIYFRHKENITSGFTSYQGYVVTGTNEPEYSRTWIPCWDKPSDKATTDITAKVPANVLFAASGRYADSVRIADTIYYRWISRDPMPTYVIGIAGSIHYKLVIKYWHKFSNPSDSIPIRFYYKEGVNIANVRDSIFLIANYFSQRFGDYPFEKIGFASFPGYWRSENQTLILLGDMVWIYESPVEHEFAHEWFGNYISIGTWADVWLKEGFARYCSALMLEYRKGYSFYYNYLLGKANYYLLNNPGWPIYNPSWAITLPSYEILFNTAITYNKASNVLYILRNTIGDSLFFRFLKSYTTDTNFTFKNVVTDDFTAKLNQVTGQDYTWFIDEWIKKPNHPIYNNKSEVSNLLGNNWKLKYTINQIQTNTTFFIMPVELKVKFADNSDSLIKIFNNSNNQLFTFYFSKKPVSVLFDPCNKIILKDVISGFYNQCSTTVKSINDLQVLRDTLHVSQQGVIKYLKINLNINHTNDGDLLIRIRSPGNIKFAILSKFYGEGGQNFSNTIFDDTAALSISQGTPPFTGRFRPEDSLFVFRDLQMSGDWILEIYDIKTGNQGTLLNWCIQIAYADSTTIGINNISSQITKEYKLFQNYPNPFNPTTSIRFDLPKSLHTKLIVYDMLGKEIAILVNEKLNAGSYEVEWPAPSGDGSGYPSGVYFYRLTAGDFTATRKMVLIK